ncbi:MAG: 2-hydroxyglutaryl-CoA dehydratase [Firmicutes bacterium]|nr:2-hydroxyglutaryl-CoA dehydratase [Bacillota bacterium]
MIGIGIDIGSVSTKGVLIRDGEWRRSIVATGWSPREAGEMTIEHLLHETDAANPTAPRIVVTGYGRVTLKQADRAITEITCHARGIAELYPDVKTIIDIGGQDSKVIHLGMDGKVQDFVMNDKCAAGTGRFLEVMASALGLDVSELGAAEDLPYKVAINSMCTVFAETEIIGLLAQGTPKGGIIAGMNQAVAKRVAAMAKRLGVRERVAFTGGVAKNQGVGRALEQELGCPIVVPEDCQFTGALGAALIACGR